MDSQLKHNALGLEFGHLVMPATRLLVGVATRWDGGEGGIWCGVGVGRV